MEENYTLARFYYAAVLLIFHNSFAYEASKYYLFLDIPLKTSIT